VKRLETLIKLKETHLVDLTKRLHDLKLGEGKGDEAANF
jgi:hypothetical protein